jgi:adenylate kinase family enzyme
MERIVILGCAGSGKTTLARLLARRTGCPLIILDDDLAATLVTPRHSGFPGDDAGSPRWRFLGQ